jgi:hypothetical protein
MKYVKLFESWVKNSVNEAEDFKPKDITTKFPIDTETYGTMHFVTNKSEDNTEELAKYLQSKLTSFTKNLKTKSGSPISFKVTYNKKDDVVEVTSSNKPNEKFTTQGEYLSKGNSKAGAIYQNTMFTYSGFIKRDGKDVFIDKTGFQGTTDNIPLGLFIASTIENKDIEDINVKTPSDLAMTYASAIDSSKEGKYISPKDIAGKLSTPSQERNTAPTEEVR